jgi:Uma2 family endonuclease
VSAQPFKRNATYADLASLPEGWTGQLVDGDLWAFARPAPAHALAITRLLKALGPEEADRETGWIFLFEVEFWFGKHMLVPDIAGWRRPRAPNLEEQTQTVTPDWVCEGLSPSTARLDRGRKREIYAEHNVGHLWLADPANKTIEVLALDGAQRYQIHQVGGAERTVLAPFGTELDLAQLWSL